MKKRFIFFTLLLLTLIGGAKFNVLNAQETITIGEGTTTSYYAPYANYYGKYSVSQQIYLKEEINKESGLITSISFHHKYGYNRTRNIVVYMNNVDKDSYTSQSDWVLVSESDKVYDGDCTFSGSGEWATITLQSPFPYTGGDLVITINDKTGTKENSYDAFNATLVSSYRGLYKYNDNEAYDCSNLTTITGTYLQAYSYTTYSYTPFIANLKFTVEALSASVKVSAESIALGDVRLGNYWTEKNASANVEIKATATTITSI